MDSSRDSSVWRSLAVTFGGGLALGAVGMKLSQNMHRMAEIPAQPYHPAPPPPVMSEPPTVPPPMPTHSIEPKVIEAVVRAVDLRLSEQAQAMERRLAQLEARQASDVAALRSEDRINADAAQAKIRDAQNSFLEQMITIRAAVVDELNHFGDEISKMVSDQVTEQMANEVEARAAALESSVEGRIVTAVAAATAARFDEELAPLRAEVAAKEKELLVLRQRLADSERNVLDVVLTIGQVCRQAAERLGVTSQPEVPAPAIPEKVHVAPEPATTAAPVQTSEPIPITAGPIEEQQVNVVEPEMPLEPVAETPAPGFTQPGKSNRLWRVPLVSSVIMTMGLLLLRYL